MEISSRSPWTCMEGGEPRSDLERGSDGIQRVGRNGGDGQRSQLALLPAGRLGPSSHSRSATLLFFWQRVPPIQGLVNLEKARNGGGRRLCSALVWPAVALGGDSIDILGMKLGTKLGAILGPVLGARPNIVPSFEPNFVPKCQC